jgi:hypothetical protein
MLDVFIAITRAPLLRAGSPIASGVAYGVSLLIAHHVQPIAAKTYNDLCAIQGPVQARAFPG